MKRKTLTLALCLLATFALASIGFASWIIANPELIVDGTTKGSFVVYDTTDNSVSVKVEFTKDSEDNEINQIIFGKSADYVAGEDHWLTPGEEILVENLSVTINFTVTNLAQAENGLEYMVLVTEADYQKLVAAKTANLITFSADLFAEVTDAEGTVLGYGVKKEFTNATDTYTLTFEWGSAFGGENPVDYYNAGSYTEDAKKNLDELAKLNGIKFNLTIQEIPAEESAE